MFYRKRMLIIAVMVALVCCILVMGCGQEEDLSDQNNDSKVTEQEIDIKEQYTMRIGYASIGDPQDLAAQTFKENLNKLVGDAITVELYPAGQLGSNDVMLQQVQEGAIEAVLNPPAFLGGRYETVTMLDLPYLLEMDLLSAVEFLNGPIGQELDSGLEEIGLKNIRYFPQGERIVITNFPVKDVGSFQGKKIRAMQAQTQVDMYNSWGASGVPLGVPELYTSLQQGTIDGADTVAPFAYNMKYHEVCTHIYMAPMVPMPVMFIVNKSWFDSLPIELQDAIESAASDDELCDEAMSLISSSLEKMEVEGNIELIYPNEDDLEILRQKALIVHENFLKLNPEAVDIYNKIVDSME